MIYKVLAGICFALAFLVSVVLFTGYGSDLIDQRTAMFLFLLSGGIALSLNLISYRTGKHSPKINFYFWLGSIIVFVALVGWMIYMNKK